MVDRNLGVIAALKASAAEYKKVKGVWGLLGVQFLFSIVPFANFILGILYYCAPAIRYRQIAAAVSAQDDSSESQSGDIREVLGDSSGSGDTKS
jgi:hypothetical protein